MRRVTAKGPCYKLLVLYQFYSAMSAAVFSSQEVQYNPMQAMSQHKLIMLCTDKGSMVQAQYCSEWTELVMVGESWGMANDGEWRTKQYLVEWVKVIKCFHPRMLTPPKTRVNTNLMELSYHSLSWYLQKSFLEKNEFFWMIQLIRQNFINHLKVVISYFICKNIGLVYKMSYIWDTSRIILVKITFIPIFLWPLGNGERLPFPWQLIRVDNINPFKCDCITVSCKSIWYNKNSFNIERNN